MFVNDLKESIILIHSIYIVRAFWQSLLSIRKYEVCLERNILHKTNHKTNLLQYIVSKLDHHNKLFISTPLNPKLYIYIYIYLIYCIEKQRRSNILLLLKDIYSVCHRIINEVYILVYNDVPQPILNIVLYINDNNGAMDTKSSKTTKAFFIIARIITIV